MNIERDYSPDGDWYNRVLILWQEDDARPHDRELTTDAFRRISGSEHHSKISAKDCGDHWLHLYRGGWVEIYFPEGGAVGVVVKAGAK